MIDRAELRSTLVKWTTELHCGESLSTVSLRHVLADERVVPVQSWSFPSTKPVDEVVDEIAAKMERDAQGLKGEQAYVVGFHFGESRHADVRLTYSVFAALIAPSDVVGASEGISPQGQLARNQRHLESHHRTTINALELALQTVSRQNSVMLAENNRLRDRIDAADLRRENYMVQTERMLSEQHARELATVESEERRAFMRDIGKKALLYLPVIVNRLSGKQVMPETVTPETELLRAFIDNAEPEKLSQMVEQMSALFTQEQLLPLYEVFQKFITERDARSASDVKKLSEKSDTVHGNVTNGAMKLVPWSAPSAS